MRARKPRDYELMFEKIWCRQTFDKRVRYCQIGDLRSETLSAAQCRRLAAWLVRAAEWIEAKEEGR